MQERIPNQFTEVQLNRVAACLMHRQGLSREGAILRAQELLSVRHSCHSSVDHFAHTLGQIGMIYPRGQTHSDTVPPHPSNKQPPPQPPRKRPK